MTDDSSAWWYSLVAASPQPESGETVNVALLVGNGAPMNLEFEPGLPRLTGVAAKQDRHVLERVLEETADRLRAGLDVSTLRAMLGPQLRLSSPRALFESPTPEVLATLRRQYLSPATRAGADEARKLVRRSERELDRLVSRVARFGIREIDRDVTPARLYAHAADWAGAVKVPRLARALRGDRRDLLLDSVVLVPGQTDLAIRSATQRIGRAFWYYKRLAKDIVQQDGTEVRAVGVIMGAPGELTPEVRDARDFIRHSWERDADVVDAIRNGREELREKIDWVVAV